MDYYKSCIQNLGEPMVHCRLSYKDPTKQSWSDLLKLRQIAKKDFPWLTTMDFYFTHAGNTSHPEQIALGFDVHISMSQAEVPYTTIVKV